MRSACHFPANSYYRSGGHRSCRASRTTIENRQRIPQDSSDGEISSGSASYLSRGSSPRQVFLARRFRVEETVVILIELYLINSSRLLHKNYKEIKYLHSSVRRCHAAQLSTALRLNQRQQLRRRHQDDIAHTLSDVHKAVPRILPCINNVLWKIQ
jgi:hypothetical protein